MNVNLVWFQVKCTCLLSRITLKLTVKPFYELKSAFLSLFVAWNLNLVCFQVKSTSLPSRISLKLTFNFLSWNRRFWAYSLHEMKTLLRFQSEMDILAIVRFCKIHLQPFFEVDSTFFCSNTLRKINSLQCFKLSKSLPSLQADPLI